MPRYSLRNGQLSRDGVTLVCPFVNRLIVPTNLGGFELQITGCGTWCPLCVLVAEENTVPFVSLRCCAKMADFEVEIEMTEQKEPGSILAPN